MKLTALRMLLFAVPLSLGLAACLETFSSPEYSPTASRTAKANTSDQVRQRLRSECLRDEGQVFRPSGDVSKQCECYADGVARSMSRDDLAFYAQYGVIPTLTAARPEDVRRRCGLEVRLAGPKRSVPPSERD